MEKKAENNGRLYPRQPICGVGAIVFNRGRILLVKRDKEPYQGLWTIPGGGVELGETAAEAARREVMEECGVEIEIERLLDVADNIIRDKEGRIRFHYILVDFAAKYVSGELKPETKEAPCGWFTPEEVAKIDVTPPFRAMMAKHGIIKQIEAKID